MNQETIYLLDLNYTLVANSEQKCSPFLRQIEREVYREELIDRLRGERVFLITARPLKYRVPTLASIEMKTGWHPERDFFNGEKDRPPIAKQKALKAIILPEYPDARFVAIESNPATRVMYARHGIAAMTYDQFLGT